MLTPVRHSPTQCNSEMCIVDFFFFFLQFASSWLQWILIVSSVSMYFTLRTQNIRYPVELWIVTSSITWLIQLICLICFVLKRSCWSNNCMKSIHHDLQWDGQTLSTVKRVRLDVAVQDGIKEEVSVYYHPIWRKCLNHVAFSLITLDICCTILISENIVQHFRILINFHWDVSVSLIDLFIFCVLREIHAGGPSTWPLPCFPQMAGNRKCRE